MGRVLLCTGNVAKNPYELKSHGVRIYTIEELCFCIGEDTLLIDDTLPSAELVDWIDRECGLSELAASLQGFTKGKTSVASFCGTILEYTGYYGTQDRVKIEQFLKSSASLDRYEKKKMAADYLAKSGKYRQAVSQYAELMREIPHEDKELLAKVYHNTGCVCSKLFLFELAAASFEEAFSLSGNSESAVQYLAAKRFVMEEEDYISYASGLTGVWYEASLELERRMERAELLWHESSEHARMEMLERRSRENPADFQVKTEEIAEKLKDAYRRMVEEK